MNLIHEVPEDPLGSRPELISATPERLEHIRIFAELAAVGAGPANLPFTAGSTVLLRSAPLRVLGAVPHRLAAPQPG